MLLSLLSFLGPVIFFKFPGMLARTEINAMVASSGKAKCMVDQLTYFLDITDLAKQISTLTLPILIGKACITANHVGIWNAACNGIQFSWQAHCARETALILYLILSFFNARCNAGADPVFPLHDGCVSVY